jgi:uncharacterized protein
MKILIDIGHPAHVHLFKHFAWEMQLKGHKVLYTCRDKEFEIRLLTTYGFQFVNFGKKFTSTLGKILGMLIFDFKELKVALKFKPDIFISHGSIYAAHAAWLIRKPHISMEDTYNFEQIRLYLPFTKHVLTAEYDHPLKTDKLIKYAGYHELAYLHPNRFSPDATVLQDLGIKEGEKYIIMRFVSWNASHDIGHKGISFENKLKAIKEFSKYAKVFISSEGALPKELEKHRIQIRPERMHDAIAFSSFVFGESSTMSEEAAMLGIPSIYLFNNSTFYTSHLERDYQIMFNYSESEVDQKLAIDKGVELLNSNDISEQWLQKRNKILSEKIDVTAFMVWFIENYPQSVKIMK